MSMRSSPSPQILYAATPDKWLGRFLQRIWRLTPNDKAPLTLTHNRIYILPTKRGWGFVFVLMLMLITSMNYGLSLGYALTFILAGLMMAGLLQTFRNLSAISIATQENEPAAFCGEWLNFSFLVSNHSNVARRDIRLFNREGVEIAFDLAAQSSQTIALTLPAEQRGKQWLGRLTLHSNYPLGLWRAWAYIHFAHNGLVYPKPESAPPPLPMHGGIGMKESSHGRGEDDLTGLRAYQIGDSLRSVAWKAVARGAGWYSKEFTGLSGGECELRWRDLPNHLSIEDKLSRLTAWVLAAEKAVCRYRLELPGFQLTADHGPTQAARALSALALFEAPQRYKSYSKPKPVPTPLLPIHLRWLALTLLAVQLPVAPYLPLWVAALGMGLIATRWLLDRYHMKQPNSIVLAVFAVMLAVAIRQSMGYVGRDTFVAFLYVLVSLKFLEAKRERDAGVLICLAAFLLLTQYFYRQGILTALSTIPAVVILTATLSIIRSSRFDDYLQRAWQPLVRQAGKLLLYGIPLALLFFLLFPRIAGPLWSLPSDRHGKTGLSETMSPGSIVGLSLSDEVAFRVEFYGATPPPPELRYWRGPVLTEFDGETWRMLHSALRMDSPRLTRSAVHYEVLLEPHQRNWLFALEFPNSVPDGALLTRDQRLLSTTAISSIHRYQTSSALSDRYSEEAPSMNHLSRRLPAQGNPQSRALVQQLMEEQGPSNFINALLSYFSRQDYAYTLEPPPYEGIDGIDKFLFEGKLGFCEHYAGAFVYLLRVAGIPARVVTGYQGGEMSPDNDYMIVRQSDAHAWAEAWLDGAWRRFDPTAMVAPTRINGGLGAALPTSALVPLLARVDFSWLKEWRLQWDAVNYAWQRWVVGYNKDRQKALFSELGWPKPESWQFIIVLTITAVAWCGLMAWWFQRRRAPRDPLLRLWKKFCQLLNRAGLPHHPAEGPLAYAQRAGLRWPEFAQRLSSFATIYANGRYGRLDKPATLLPELRQAMRELPSIKDLQRVRAKSY